MFKSTVAEIDEATQKQEVVAEKEDQTAPDANDTVRKNQEAIGLLKEDKDSAREIDPKIQESMNRLKE